MVVSFANNTVKEIVSDLLTQAYGGSYPEGGYDFPSCCVLSRSDEYDSDFHIEFRHAEHEEVDGGRFIDNELEVMYRPEVGPGDTDSPFVENYDDIIPPGLFGEALHNYGKAQASLKELGVDGTRLDLWFKGQWGIAEDEDLSEVVPTVRSHGDAFFGGISRKLAPDMVAHPEASNKVQVKWHSKSRTDFGEHKLVDWPRLNAIARSIGNRLVTEDEFYPQDLKRLDYRVIRREIPDAPQNVQCKSLQDLKVVNRPKSDFTKNAIVALKDNLRIQREKRYFQDSVEVDEEEDLAIPKHIVVEELQQDRWPANFIDLDTLVESDTLDIQEPPQQVNIQATAESVRKGEDVLYQIARSKDYVNMGILFRNFRDLVDGYWIGELSEEDRRFLERTVHNIFGEYTLKLVYHIFAFAYGDKDVAMKQVVSIMRQMKARPGLYKELKLQAIWKELLTTRAGIDYLLPIVSRAVFNYEKDKGRKEFHGVMIRKEIMKHGDPYSIIDALITRRKNWYVSVYKLKAKYYDQYRVTYQLRAKLFKHTKFLIKSFGDVEPLYNHKKVLDVLLKSGRAYAYHRSKHFLISDIDRCEIIKDLPVMANRLDEILRPSILYSRVVGDYFNSVRYLVEDAKKFMRKVITSDEFEEIQENHCENAEIDVEKLSRVVPDDTVKSIPTDDSHNKFAMDEDELDDDEEENVHRDKISLVQELEEDYPGFSLEDIQYIVDHFSPEIRYSEYKRVKEFVAEYIRKKMIENMRAKKDFEDGTRYVDI